jgi:hypothetical protein
MQLKQTLLIISLASSSFLLQAQSASSSESSFDFDEIENVTISDSDWTFYLDEDNKTYYIDFETISVNLSDIRVYDEKGQLVKEDELWNLPVNTIYELNLSDIGPGNYKVELRTYTGKITKEVVIAD